MPLGTWDGAQIMTAAIHHGNMPTMTTTTRVLVMSLKSMKRRNMVIRVFAERNSSKKGVYCFCSWKYCYGARTSYISLLPSPVTGRDVHFSISSKGVCNEAVCFSATGISVLLLVPIMRSSSTM
jgi:hypothetical protein